MGKIHIQPRLNRIFHGENFVFSKEKSLSLNFLRNLKSLNFIFFFLFKAILNILRSKFTCMYVCACVCVHSSVFNIFFFFGFNVKLKKQRVGGKFIITTTTAILIICILITFQCHMKTLSLPCHPCEETEREREKLELNEPALPTNPPAEKKPKCAALILLNFCIFSSAMNFAERVLPTKQKVQKYSTYDARSPNRIYLSHHPPTHLCSG